MRASTKKRRRELTLYKCGGCLFHSYQKTILYDHLQESHRTDIYWQVSSRKGNKICLYSILNESVCAKDLDEDKTLYFDHDQASKISIGPNKDATEPKELKRSENVREKPNGKQTTRTHFIYPDSKKESIIRNKKDKNVKSGKYAIEIIKETKDCIPSNIKEVKKETSSNVKEIKEEIASKDKEIIKIDMMEYKAKHRKEFRESMKPLKKKSKNIIENSQHFAEQTVDRMKNIMPSDRLKEEMLSSQPSEHNLIKEMEYLCKICSLLLTSLKQYRKHCRKEHGENNQYDKEMSTLQSKDISWSHPFPKIIDSSNDIKPRKIRRLETVQEDKKVADELLDDKKIHRAMQKKEMNNNSDHVAVNVVEADSVVNVPMKGEPTKELMYACGLCNVLKKSYKRLRRHYSKCHEEISLYDCNSCKFLTHVKIVFQEHLAETHQDITETHQDISERLPSQQKAIVLNQHEQTIDNSSMSGDQKRKTTKIADVSVAELGYECKICNVLKKSYKRLRRHYSKCHEEILLYECNNCKFFTHNKTIFQEHLSESHQNNTAAYQNNTAAHQDISEAHQDISDRPQSNAEILPHTQKAIALNQTEQSINNKSGDQRSMVQKIPDVSVAELGYECKICNVLKKSYKRLRRHYSKFHEEISLYECNSCKFLTHDKIVFQEHLAQPHQDITEAHQDITEILPGQQKAIDLNQVEETTGDCLATDQRRDDSMTNQSLTDVTAGGNHSECNAKNKFLGEQSITKLVYNQPLFYGNFSSSEINTNTLKEVDFVSKCNGTQFFKCKGFYNCMFCEYRSQYKRSVIEHVRTHTGEKPFKCLFCDYASARKRTLTEHMKKHTNETVFQCELCNYKCLRMYEFKIHLRAHTGEKPFQCSYCDYATATKRNLTQHVKKKHPNETNVKCELCEYQCHTGYELKLHLRTHAEKTENTCPICLFAAANTDSLANHIKTHSNLKPFQCPLCDFATILNYRLSKHIRIHTNERPFQCETCGFRFNVKDDLNKHIRTHTGEKPYQCEYCHLCFSLQNSYSRHKRRKH